MNRGKRILSCLLVVVLLLWENSFAIQAASMQYRKNVAVKVDGVEVGTIPAVDDDYVNNLYLSMKGLASVLTGTEKAFSPYIKDQTIEITTGKDYTTKVSTWGDKALASSVRYTLRRSQITLDGADRRYFAFLMENADGAEDAFFLTTSLAMLLDLNVTFRDGVMEIDTSKSFTVTKKDLEASGYDQDVNSLLVGDGSTGEIFYSSDRDEQVPIASTTKLMTYFVTMDAVAAGECALYDTATVSVKAAKLSHGSDGVISLKTGSKIPLEELLYGMLLPSSNECALVIAEHVAGSEEAFVERMNQKAKELGMAEAEFYNCHGLPAFENQALAGKIQNHMSAEEMFRMVSVLVDTYPEITKITASKVAELPNLGKIALNSNALLYNMSDVRGLKTGTTNKAGACLVTYLPVERNGVKHNLICVLFGAEGEVERMNISEVAARFAVQYLDNPESDSEASKPDTGIPGNPELVIEKLIRMNCK